ncbi:hypothetical protein B5F74_01310 [Collinsella sp. An271]|uniref:hypothetical protein n=1 Tax=Collinsella sp. An271 TaxID=1965616 RepID=UPI000B374CFD|nr:hypothetical protein [Collinsella sp. An271]OUO62537.1 hypothetical protein B5F74_01310 [Collinsella sp. An271]
MASIMNDYATKMNQIALTPRMRSALAERIAAERARVQQQPRTTASQPSASTERRRGRVFTRRRAIAVAACTAGLALGCTALGILWAPSEDPASAPSATQSDQTGGSSNSSAAAAAQASFVLAAYADGTPVEDRSDTVLAGPGFLDSVSSWEAGPDDDDNNVLRARSVFSIDLTAYGDDITQLDYRIDGDETVQLCYLGSRNYRTPDGSFEDMHGQSMTITQDMLERIGTIDGGTFSVELNYALPDDFWAIYERAKQESTDEFRFESIAYGAQLLAGRTITITATFVDGTTLTHEYRIDPVDTFKETLMANDQAFHDSFDDESTDEFVPEPLFTIEQVS